MKWEEYKNKESDKLSLLPPGTWIQTEIECPVCGELIYKNYGLVLASYPPKFQYRCIKCNWAESWY